MTHPALSARWQSLRDDARARRAKHAARANFERELSGYWSPGQLSDLRATAARYDGVEAESIRAILSSRV